MFALNLDPVFQAKCCPFQGRQTRRHGLEPQWQQYFSLSSMVVPSEGHLLLLCLLLCFITMTARARSLREIKHDDAVKKAQTGLFKPQHEAAQQSNDELDTMDYTPAKRNPPIHN
ncbi:hypothetical protein ACSQ67_004717 [Phaseolus vulgaris]